MHSTLICFVSFVVNYVSAHDREAPPTNCSCQALVTTLDDVGGGVCNCVEDLLELRCDRLDRVPQFSDGFRCVLSGVYMANQSIRRLGPNAFSNLSTRRLVLSFNNIEDRLHAAAFSGNLSTVLQELYLGACRLSVLPLGLLDNMNSLNVLHLWHNRIAQIPADLFADCVSLRELILSYNAIVSLDANTFTALRNLRKLDLDGNEISSLSRDVFSGLDNLQVIS